MRTFSKYSHSSSSFLLDAFSSAAVYSSSAIAKSSSRHQQEFAQSLITAKKGSH